ncbi:hypothetical protein JTE90_017595 [Oedothorax gibbosus]|uniref:Uncharacterized protein n=1 Tax=Oedothorax gibbosus TaxID=931172 RepID=A0AAV6TMI3_9ARAC|nr:hypothetical protein JTE90_017595 [Oedothorax gibbosus]
MSNPSPSIGQPSGNPVSVSLPAIAVAASGAPPPLPSAASIGQPSGNPSGSVIPVIPVANPIDSQPVDIAMSGFCLCLPRVCSHFWRTACCYLFRTCASTWWLSGEATMNSFIGISIWMTKRRPASPAPGVNVSSISRDPIDFVCPPRRGVARPPSKYDPSSVGMAATTGRRFNPHCRAYLPKNTVILLSCLGALQLFAVYRKTLYSDASLSAQTIRRPVLLQRIVSLLCGHRTPSKPNRNSVRQQMRSRVSS